MTSKSGSHAAHLTDEPNTSRIQVVTSAERLAGPMLKLDRADKHISDLYDAIREFAKSGPCAVRHEDDREAGKRTTYLERIDPLPAALALIIGDALHNLRSSLDHLAAQLVCVAERRERLEGEAAERISFPIGPSAKDYPSVASNVMRRANPDALKHIDGIQPYKGGKGHLLWVLHRLDIADKHRLLLTVASLLESDIVTTDIRNAIPGFPAPWAFQMHRIATGGPVPVRLMSALNDRFPLKAGDVLFTGPIEADPNHQIQFRIEVALNEPEIIPQPEPAVRTLGNISKELRTILPSFLPFLEPA